MSTLYSTVAPLFVSEPPFLFLIHVTDDLNKVLLI